jgi:hypothetical protein
VGVGGESGIETFHYSVVMWGDMMYSHPPLSPPVWAEEFCPGDTDVGQGVIKILNVTGAKFGDSENLKNTNV